MGFRGEEEGGEERGRRVGAGGRVDVAADREREREKRTRNGGVKYIRGKEKREKGEKVGYVRAR